MIITNKTKDDILIKKELDWLEAWNSNLKVIYTLTRHSEEKHGRWDGLQGRVNIDMLRAVGFPEPSDDVYICWSGPKGLEDTIQTTLNEGGYQPHMY